MTKDPVETNPDHYRVIFENDAVRVLAYRDSPGDTTVPHEHPNSVMHTLAPFRRRLHSGGHEREVDMPGGVAVWLDAQEHFAENIGTTDTEVVFVELKDGSLGGRTDGALGPTLPFDE